ncbi:sigma-70 family RNA polymerase sigma factor [Spirosoma sp. HMF3257]|uniref:Sigma-70 family RNA polymerase sigma factor n=1 Tax=Spirosoma telluris TaxID=2183553 RepID=A0A327NDW5_9BACT|nr:sigma-70 family RNA polymerase sigma factor [Spirosoma telluris]RAI73491.1 sigma-70 family RNA polymerase sigma factor [Spirosoma telluris]
MTLQDEFVEQIQMHQALLNKLVYLYADQTEDRNDLHQEILLQAWRSYPNFRGDAKFSTWLYRVGLNVSLTKLNDQKQRQSAALDETAQSTPSTFESDDQLRYVLQQVNTLDRTLIVMSMDGYSNEEIAETLGISPGNVRTKLHRIRQKIDKLWN